MTKLPVIPRPLTHPIYESKKKLIQTYKLSQFLIYIFKSYSFYFGSYYTKTIFQILGCLELNFLKNNLFKTTNYLHLTI